MMSDLRSSGKSCHTQTAQSASGKRRSKLQPQKNAYAKTNALHPSSASGWGKIIAAQRNALH
jgi:hypothetical protein